MARVAHANGTASPNHTYYQPHFLLNPPFHLLSYPIYHIYPCSTPLLQQLTLTKLKYSLESLILRLSKYYYINHIQTYTCYHTSMHHTTLFILPFISPHQSKTIFHIMGRLCKRSSSKYYNSIFLLLETMSYIVQTELKISFQQSYSHFFLFFTYSCTSNNGQGQG